MLASKKNGTLYVGITNNLLRRVYEHKNDLLGGFTRKYNVKILVYYEVHQDIYQAILEKNVLRNGNDNGR